MQMPEEAKAPPRQISVLVDRDTLNNMGPGEREWMETFLGSHVFQQFCKGNVDAVQTNLAELNPGAFTPEDFVNLSKDMRLLWRFWTDLLRLAEEYTPHN
jgi:hypothetical protein